MSDTLKQVYMDRDKMMQQNKGATESSRVALSAVSARNILKTKTETAKIKRDEDVAAEQIAAAVAQNDAAGAVSLEKTKTSIAQNLDHTRRNEVLSMMNIGIYNPSFSGILNMPDSVVKTAAEKKAAEIQAKKAAKAAAAQAQAEYEEELRNRDEEEEEKVKKAEAYKNVDSAIDAAEKNGTVAGTAAEVKENILSAANVGKVLMPWATPTSDLLGITEQSALNVEKNVRFSGGKVTEQVDKQVQQAKKQAAAEKEISEKNIKAAADYYDKAVTERIYKKEKAVEELTPLEAAFKAENENSTAYTLWVKRFTAEDKMKNATTAEEVNTAYNEFLSALDERRTAAIDAAFDIQDQRNLKRANAEDFTAEERAYLEETREELQSLRAVLALEIEEIGLSEEGKEILQTELENVDTAIEVVESAILYNDQYAEVKDTLINEKMESKYGQSNTDDLQQQAEQIKKELIETHGGYKKRPINPLVGDLNAFFNERLENDPRYLEYIQLTGYIEKRKNLQEEAEQDERVAGTIAEMPGETLSQKYKAVLSATESAWSYMDEFIPNGFYNWDKELQEQWKQEFAEKWNGMSQAEREGLLRDAQFTYSVKRETNEEVRKDASGYFHRNIVASNEALFSEKELEQYAEEAVKNYREAEKHPFMSYDSIENRVSLYASQMWKYNKGIDGLYEGDYSSVVEDFEGFLEGDYGSFTEKEAKTILALMAKYGTDEAFVHYAAVRDQALRREAEDFTGFGRVVRGMTSGLTNFLTNGGEMLENAFTQQYSRIAGTLSTASHQIVMDRFTERTGIGNDALELLYMSGYSIFDMLPAVAAGAVPVVGSTLSAAYTFAKVTATTYNDSILQGKRADEALTYSLLSATAEVTMEKILSTGGQTFAKTGFGKVMKEGIENLASTKAMQVILKTAGSMGSEGFEEFLQECLSPFLEKVAADLNGIDDATLKEIDWEEAAKSFAVGALTGSVLGGLEAISSSKNAGMKESEAQYLLESGAVAQVIQTAAMLGNKKADTIMKAYQQGQALYEGREGWFAYASPADVINMIQSTKRRSYRLSLKLLEEKYAKLETRKEKQGRFRTLFKKILQGNTLTAEEIAEIINDHEMSTILSDMLGFNVVTMDPNRVRAVAKLLAFAPDGKISQERRKLFKDAFGEIDVKAIEEIVKYSDMGAQKGAGIIYEDADAESQLTEAEQESAEVLKILSTEVGTVFYVTEQFETGTYLAANVMAVRRGDLAGGVAQTILHRVYYITKQLNPKAGKTIHDLVLEELNRTIGKEVVDAEIKQIRRQAAENGNDIGDVAADQELCARHFPSIILKGAAVEKIAQMDINAANALRKALRAVQEHLKDTVISYGIRQDMPESYRYNYLKDAEITVEQGVELSAYQEILDKLSAFNPRAKSKAEELLYPVAQEMELINTPLETPELDFSFNFSHKSFSESIHNQLAFGGSYVEFAKAMLNMDTVLKNAVVIEQHSDKYAGTSRQNENLETTYVLLSAIRDGDTIIPVQMEIKKLSNTESVLYMTVALKKIETDVVGPIGNKTNSLSTLVPVSKYSIAKIIENVNPEDKNFLKYIPDRFLTQEQRKAKTDSIEIENKKISGIFEKQGGKIKELWGDTNALYERLTALVRGEEIKTEETAGTDREPTYTDAEQVRAENDGADSARNFEDLTPEERDAKASQMMAEVDEYMNLLIKTEEEERGEPIDTSTMVGAKKGKEKFSLGRRIYNKWNGFRRMFTDSAATVYDISKKHGDWGLYHFYDAARRSMQMGVNMIRNAQTDISGNKVGKSLAEVWAPILAQGKAYSNTFNEYLLHLHNIDRMSRYSEEAVEQARHQYQVIKEFMADELKQMSDGEIRAVARDSENPLCYEAREYVEALDFMDQMRNMKDKPVFGYRVTAEDSRAKAEEFERLYPEFKEYREEVYKYLDNLMQYRVDSGLVSAETAAKLKQIYPHYVPTARTQSKEAESKKKWFQREKNREQVGRTVGRASGGDADIIDLYQQLADQTMSVVREGAKNRFGMRLLTMAQKNKLQSVQKIEKVADKVTDPLMFDRHLDEADPFIKLENKNVIGIFMDGELWEMEVTGDLYEAVNALNKSDNDYAKLFRPLEVAVNAFKKLVTEWNLKFLINNPFRDFADALFTSKDTKAWIMAIPQAIKELKNNGELWQQYQALGGTYTSVFDMETMTDNKGEVYHETIGRISALNQAIEQIPRFAEFIATVQKGDGSHDNLMEAMYNAADITTNFGRSGTWGKNINRYVIPFFNPAVQGVSKAVRMVTEQGSFKGFVQLGLKAVFFGIAPAVINALIYSDDEEWENIRQSDKDRYFLFKVKEGLWLRIPKGRMVSVIGAAGERVRHAIEGDEVEWASFIGTTVDQMAPSNPLTSNIFGPVILASINRTWYGTDIVNQRLEQLPSGEQYDAKTDEISKWIGSVTGLSPKKVNYVLDAYSGVAGDLLLPLLTPSAERTFLEQSFTLDSNYSNRLSEDFYAKKKELSDNKNSKNGTALDAAMYRRWNRNADAISEINAEIRKIEEDTTLSGGEKKELLKAQYAARNTLMLSFEDYYEEYSKAAKEISQKTVGMSEEDAEEYIYRETNRAVLGTEEALKAHSKQTWERANKIKKEQGIDFDTFYDVNFAEGEPDTEKCFKLIEEGFETESALEISRQIGALEPEDGKKSVSDLQKYKAIDASNVTEGEKMQAMAVLATDTDQRRLAVGADYNITLKQFIAIKDDVTYLNEQNKGGVTNGMVKAAIDHTEDLTTKQKAVIWQLFTGSTSAKNNPYSVSIGQETIAKNKAYKAASEK